MDRERERENDLIYVFAFSNVIMSEPYQLRMHETVAKYNSQGTDHYSSTARGSWRILIVSQKNLLAPTGTGKFTFFKGHEVFSSSEVNLPYCPLNVRDETTDSSPNHFRFRSFP